MPWFMEYKYALASLKRAPEFLLTTVLTLALTLGAVLITASIGSTFLVNALPYPDADELKLLQQNITIDGSSDIRFQSVKGQVQWYKDQTVFEQHTLVHTGYEIGTSLQGEPRLNVSYVTPDYFPMLGVPLVLGRGFNQSEDIDRGAKALLISEKTWREYFNADPQVTQKSITLGAQQYRILGVISSRFLEPYLFGGKDSALWLPFDAGPQMGADWERTFAQLKSVGRPKAGVTDEQIATELESIIESIRDQWSGSVLQEIDPHVSLFRDAEIDNNDKLSLLLVFGALSLLLIAVVNLTNLFFSRALANRKKLVIKAIVGAKQRNLFLALFSEISVICFSGWGLSVLIAYFGVEGFIAMAKGYIPLVEAIHLEFFVLLVTFVLALVLALFFAYITLKRIDYRNLKNYIQGSGKGTSNQVSGRTIKVLVGAQVFLATGLLLVSSMVLSKALQHKVRDIGSDISDVYNVHVTSTNKSLNTEEIIGIQNAIKDMIRRMPGVADVASGGGPIGTRFYAYSLADMDKNSYGYLRSTWIGEHYLDLLNINLIKGRYFSDAAYRGEAKEILVTQSASLEIDPNGDVIGKSYIGLNDEVYEIIGITNDVFDAKIKYYNYAKGSRIWWPQVPEDIVLKVKMQNGQVLNRLALLDAIKQVNESLILWEYNDLEQLHVESVYQQTILVYLSSGIALITLLLASIGIFGVLNYNSNLRRFEFGIRMALGAKQRQLYALVNKESLLPVLIGLISSSALVLVLIQIFAVTLEQWVSISLVQAVLVIVFSALISMAACVLPMRNILKNKPIQSLRET
ncbi:ABC transporter permease [Alteromonas sp. a30]|uniref:ABC transporter permease n=1 Tax=Alteromonas sp. a30 TaxID=2730917 RepID=UPI00227FDADB|nr:ABC transporter permease [Alteromonas sp. a30]MCY7296889.1 FtsX-like permease family protein [Alteromonas sp. a30]